MKRTNRWSRALPGVAVALLSATALAAVGDLEYAKAPPPGRGIYVNFAKPEKIETGKDIGLPTAKAVIASGAVAGIDVRVAVTGEDEYDALRLDASGKGRFGKAAVLPMKTARKDAQMYLATIGPAQVTLKKDGQAVPVTVTGRYYELKGTPRLYLQFTAAAEGSCAFGETTRKVRILDASGNLAFGEAQTDKKARGRFDLVQIADENGKFLASALNQGTTLGQPIQVGGKCYTLSVAGMKVSAEAMTCPMGKIAGSGEKWQLMLTGKKYTITVSGGAEPVEVPADTYRVTRCNYFADGGADQAAMVSSYSQKSVEVTEGNTVPVPMGLPIKVAVLAAVKKGKVTFSLKQTDAAGSRIAGILNGSGQRPAAPAIDVVDQKGAVVYTAKLEYG